MKYSTLLFDADDTLLDFHRAESEALTDTLKEYHLPCDSHIIETYSEINASLWRMLERGEIEKQRLRVERFVMLLDFLGVAHDAERLAVTYTDRLADKPFIVEGADEVCRKLSESCRMYVITNGLKSVQSKRFAASGLSGFFTRSFISEDMGYEKPDVRYFEKVSSLIPNFDRKTTLVIGDSLTSDMRGGIAFGLDTCWYNPKSKPQPENMRINYTIGSLSELADIVSGKE